MQFLIRRRDSSGSSGSIASLLMDSNQAQVLMREKSIVGSCEVCTEMSEQPAPARSSSIHPAKRLFINPPEFFIVLPRGPFRFDSHDREGTVDQIARSLRGGLGLLSL